MQGGTHTFFQMDDMLTQLYIFHAAPKVFTDVEELPPYPANTRCPHCQSYVTTEIVRTVGPVVWLVCTMTSLIG